MNRAPFPTTRWSVVLAAGSKTAAETHSARALADLCEAYWPPVYAFVRHLGFEPEEAKDLTQGFFLDLLAREDLRRLHPDAGRFRSFLRAAVKHYVSKETARSRAVKRGGGTVTISFDAQAAEARYRLEPRDDLNPERLFERRWALTVLQRAELRLAEELERTGRLDDFANLRVFIAGGQEHRSYREVAGELGLTEAALKMKVHRLRRRFGSCVRDEIADTVLDAADVDDEIRHLQSVIRG